MKNETTTIRITTETKQILEKFGKYKDNYDTIIRRIITEHIDDEELQELGINQRQLIEEIQEKPKKQMKPKTQKKPKKYKKQPKVTVEQEDIEK